MANEDKINLHENDVMEERMQKHENPHHRVSIDQYAVDQLVKYRSAMRCSLHPRKGKNPCDRCTHYEDCVYHGRERDYIHENEKKKEKCALDRARELATGDEQMHIADVSEPEDVTVEDLPWDEDVPEDTATDEVPYHNEEDENYPCGAFQYTCHTRECENGQKCPYAHVS